jgi:hypothetical protein
LLSSFIANMKHSSWSILDTVLNSTTTLMHSVLLPCSLITL